LLRAVTRLDEGFRKQYQHRCHHKAGSWESGFEIGSSMKGDVKRHSSPRDWDAICFRGVQPHRK
jgi:hypothetical protein